MFDIAFQDIIKEISEKNNTVLETDGVSSCVIKTNSDVEITLEMFLDTQNIALISSIGSVEDSHNSSDLLLEMLKASNIPHDSGFVGFDINRQVLVLNHFYSIMNFQIDDFLKSLDLFADKALALTSIIKN